MYRQYGTGKDISVMAKSRERKRGERVVHLLRGVGGPFESLSRFYTALYTRSSRDVIPPGKAPKRQRANSYSHIYYVQYASKKLSILLETNAIY